MGYCFKKKGDSSGFPIQLYNAGVVRAAAGIYERLMPEPNKDGGTIPGSARSVLVQNFREQSEMLKELADYIADADELEWTH